MIPRRRIDIAVADLIDLVQAPLLAKHRQRDVLQFETALAEYLNCPQVRSTGSGREALLLILQALGIQPGDEIIVPAYTLGELVPFLHTQGFRLIAADVDANTYTVTADSIAHCLSANTRAIIVLHTFGAPCDMESIGELARSRAIPVIEDCAHALGAEIAGRKAGTHGMAGFFSLEVNKQVATFGGGAIATGSADLAARIDTLLATRSQTEWPAMRKALLKTVEELAVRSPLYALAARLMFSERNSGFVDRHYRQLHDRVRSTAIAYSGFQARIGRRRLRDIDQRNAHMNARWNQLGDRLRRLSLRPQQRDQHGAPAFYNFAAASPVALPPLRRQAQHLGIDVAIHGEVMDDVASMLGQSNCPGAAELFNTVALFPLHRGVGPQRVDDIARRLETVLAPSA